MKTKSPHLPVLNRSSITISIVVTKDQVLDQVYILILDIKKQQQQQKEECKAKQKSKQIRRRTTKDLSITFSGKFMP